MHYIHYITRIIYDISSTLYDVTFTMCVTSHMTLSMTSNTMFMTYSLDMASRTVLWPHIHCFPSQPLFLTLHSVYFWHDTQCILDGLVGLHRTDQLKLLWHQWLGIDLDYYDVWCWIVCLEMNQDHSIVFEIAPKYCLSDSFVDGEGYSISSKGFLTVIVDTMVIWVKFAHYRPFSFTDS